MTDDNDTGPAKPAAKVLGREAKVVRKRFYKIVTVAAEGTAFVIHLDGRPVRTPKKAVLTVPACALAEAIAAEWHNQAVNIEPSAMPLTTLACTALDAVALEPDAVAAEIGRYAASDLLCYRAGMPAALAERQAAGWDPVLAWGEHELRQKIQRGTGLMPIAQSPDVAKAMVDAVRPLDPLRLAAMSVLTTLLGSAVLALALLRRHLTLERVWLLAHIDEDWQIECWGTDAEAETRRANRLRTATAAATVLAMLAE